MSSARPLMSFKRMMAEFGVESWRACATSSLRELKNPVIILEQIYQRTGIRVEILSNAEQHFLGYKSIAAIDPASKRLFRRVRRSWISEEEICRFLSLTKMLWC